VLPFGTPTINEPTATPSGLSQSIAPFFGSPFTLTINGQGFQTGANVMLGSTNLPTTVVSTSQLTSQVTTAALSVLGPQPLRVINPGNLESNVLSFRVALRGDTNGDGTVNIGDALVTALTAGGMNKPPLPLSVGDVNLNGTVNIGDALVLALLAGQVTPDWSVPVISSISETVPGDTVTISGTGFATAAEDNLVSFTTANGFTRVASLASTPTTIALTIPPDTVSGFIQVYRKDVPLGGREYPIVVSGTSMPVAVTQVAPYFNVQRGFTIALDGMGFDSIPTNNIVTFKTATGTVSASANTASLTGLTVTVPMSAVCGAMTVSSGGHVSKPRVITLSSVSCGLEIVDIIGNGAIDETLVLEGTGFDAAHPTNNIVRFASSTGNPVIAPVVAAGSTQLQVRIPKTAIDGNLTVSVGSTVSNPMFFAVHP